MQKDTQIQTQADDGFQEKKVFVIVAGHFIHDSYSAFLAPLLPLLILRFNL